MGELSIFETNKVSIGEINASVTLETWQFGKPVLEAGGEGRASWSQSTTASVSDRTVWSVRLDAGKQTSWDDYAKVIIPVNEVPFTSLESVRIQAKYGASVGIDMAPTIYIHDPDDFDQRVEVSVTPLTNDAAGTRELDYPDEPPVGHFRFWYGTVTDTPDNCPTEGTGYTWEQFQTDSVFSTWNIYKITLDYGYHTGDIVMNGCYLYKVSINDVAIELEPSLEDRVNLAIDANTNAIKNVPTWTFGEPTLTAAQNADAVWSRASATETTAAWQKGSTGWVANLYGGLQTNGRSWASVFVPVNELPLPNLASALWTYNFSAGEEYGINMVIWAHDPEDNDLRAEITQAPSHADLEKASGWNAHELSTSAVQFWYYGEISGTPDTTPTAGTQYTLAQFQGDSVFSKYTIYRISFDYGWYDAATTFADAWVGDIKINGQVIPLKPDSGGSGRIGRRFKTASSGDPAHALAPKTPFKLLSWMIHLDAAATQETLTVTVDGGRTASVYDTLLVSEAMSGIQDLVRTWEGGLDLKEDDEVDTAWANTDSATYGLTVTYQTVF